MIGISNHGNTCFINAILQCLSYTDLFSRYLVMDSYKSDLRRKRRIASQLAQPFAKRAGGASGVATAAAAAAAGACGGAGRGEVTEQLATLIKSLWSLQYDPEISSK